MSNTNSNHFFNNEIVFENHWKNVTLSQINEVIPHDFFGKKEFIEFYLCTNGGCFTNEAYIYRDSFYQVSKNDCNLIEIASFLHIPLFEKDENPHWTSSIIEVMERRDLLSENFEEFTLFHIPFADNYGDNDFWIDIQTGEIKYIDYEESYDPNDAIIVAPSFPEFCKNIQAKRR